MSKMQTLESINFGQAPNDGTGDELRTAFQKTHTNFDRIAEGVEAVEEAAAAAGQLAGEALPAAEKGAADGVAPLNSQAKVPAEYLPDEFIPMVQKGAADGVATLGADGKVTPEQLPNAVDAIPLAEKGQPGGVATLDSEGLVPGTQLAKGLANGVASLGSGGIVPPSQLPPLAHGQCRFVYVSPTECRLMPCNGNGLIINGKQYRIDAAGVPVSNAGLAASAGYYAYAKDDGSGGFGLEFQAFSAAPHSRHTDGVEIKTGDPTRTLVGMAISASTGQFIVNDTNYRIASWFNRKQIRLVEAVTTGTASSSFVGLNGGFACCGWGGETLLDLVVSGSTAGSNTYSILNPMLNGGAATTPRGTLLAAGADQMICYVWKATPAADGIYVFSQQGRSTSGTLVNWAFNQIGEVWL